MEGSWKSAGCSPLLGPEPLLSQFLLPRDRVTGTENPQGSTWGFPRTRLLFPQRGRGGGTAALGNKGWERTGEAGSSEKEGEGAEHTLRPPLAGFLP